MVNGNFLRESNPVGPPSIYKDPSFGSGKNKGLKKYNYEKIKF
jgi:hypothetical protein